MRRSTKWKQVVVQWRVMSVHTSYWKISSLLGQRIEKTLGCRWSFYIPRSSSSVKKLFICVATHREAADVLGNNTAGDGSTGQLLNNSFHHVFHKETTETSRFTPNMCRLQHQLSYFTADINSFKFSCRDTTRFYI